MSTVKAKKGVDKKSAGAVQLLMPRLLSWGLVLALIALLGGGTAWAVAALRDPAVLPLEVVRIDGDFRHIKRSDLERAIGGVMQGNFFTVDLDAVRDAALALPWVEKVTVRRIWPATLKVWVGEQTPLARWGKKRLVNDRGVVFNPQPEEIPEGLPQLSGPDDESPQVVNRYLGMVYQLSSLPLTISQVRMDDRGSWTVIFSQGLTLHLGSQARDGRLTRFRRLYSQLSASSSKQLKVMDLRYTNGMAVLWGEEKTEKRLGKIDAAAGQRLGWLFDDAGGQV